MAYLRPRDPRENGGLIYQCIDAARARCDESGDDVAQHADMLNHPVHSSFLKITKYIRRFLKDVAQNADMRKDLLQSSFSEFVLQACAI